MTRYIVKHEVDGPQILVYIYDNFTCRRLFDTNLKTWIYVSEPNRIERAMNITFETKIKNAIKKMQSIANEFNRNNDIRNSKTLTAKRVYDSVFEGKHDT